MSYFYSLEFFNPSLEEFIDDEGLVLDDLYKITVLSENIEYDIIALGFIEELINEIIEEDDKCYVVYNEKYFPSSINSDIPEDKETIFEVVDEDEFQNAFELYAPNVMYDGTEIPKQIKVEDTIIASYELGNDNLKVRAQVYIEGEDYQYVDFTTNRVVH